MSAGPKHDPQHVAIIMDGNGRWAKARGLPREVGHQRGVEALRRTVEACRSRDLSHLTVFSFSTENWKRPATEVSSLFALLRLYVRQDLKKLHSEGVRIRVIGTRAGLPDDVLSLIEESETLTAENSRFQLNIAFNYGGQDEILTACKTLARSCERGELTSDDITLEHFEQALWFRDIPDPELLIRTSGEFRISNFMLWQIAYSELVFMDCLWPDFGEDQLDEALKTYRSRDRRFGGLATESAASR